MSLLSHTREVINLVRQKTNRVVLFYSGGKDSIALLDLLAKEFDEVVCVFMYFVKGLEHVDRYMRYIPYRYSNVKLMQVPHWNLTHLLKNGQYCKPQPKVKKITIKDVDESIRLQTGINWVFYGMKKADSLERRLMLNRYENEAISTATNKVYPLSRWKNGDVLKYIQANNLPSPIQYGKKASNGVGFNIDCFLYLREHYPADLQKIITAFPESEIILHNYDSKQPVVHVQKF